MDLDTEEIRETHNLYIESTHGNLKDIIKYFYGENILAKINTFSKLRSSLAKKLSNLAFLKRCRENNIIPQFLTQGSLKNKSKNILHKTSLILIKERIHFTKSQIVQTSIKPLSISLYLNSTCSYLPRGGMISGKL